MALHGGRFETYFHRDRVTHIVCAHLPDTKLKHLAHERCAAAGVCLWGGEASLGWSCSWNLLSRRMRHGCVSVRRRLVQ